MMTIPDKIITLQIARPDHRANPDGRSPEPFSLATIPVPELRPGEVLVEIAGSNVCRRELSGIGGNGGRSPGLDAVQFPSCDISGKVVAGEAAWIGREVLIPAFLTGRFHGLSSHVPVSTCSLLEIKSRLTVPPLAHLSAAIDALAVPFQAAMLAGVTAGDKVTVLGLDGDAPLLVQLTKVLGAGTVVAVDTSDARLNTIRRYGADLVLHAGVKTSGEAAGRLAQTLGRAEQKVGGWKVFMMSRSDLYLDVVLELANQVDKLLIAGPADVGRDAALGKFAAHIIEPCGCPPEDYPRLVQGVTSGSIALSPFLLTRPMSWAKQVLPTMHETASDRRIVFTPDDFGLEDDQEARSCR